MNFPLILRRNGLRKTVKKCKHLTIKTRKKCKPKIDQPRPQGIYLGFIDRKPDGHCLQRCHQSYLGNG